jgi:hypothetical protein
MTWMEPAGFSISTRASADALRFASTFCWAAAGRGAKATAAARQRDTTVLLGIFNSLGRLRRTDTLERVDLLLVRGR